MSEIKNLRLKEISVLKETIATHINIDVLSGKDQTDKFYQEQPLFNEWRIKKQRQFDSFFVNQLSKQIGFISSLNNRFSNNAINSNNKNNDNLSHKNNSHANENNNNNNNNDNNNNNLGLNGL